MSEFVGTFEQVGFEVRFKENKIIYVMEVWREEVPEFGSRAAKSPGAHGNLSRGRKSEMETGRRSQGMRGNSSADKYGGLRL